jgi:hypothetical protein
VSPTWERQGLLFEPDRRRWWQRSHANLPTVLKLEDALHRVYFTSRDDRHRSHVGWFDVDLDSGEIVGASEEPVLAPGPPGHFDDSGVLTSSVVADGDRVWLYTTGWNVGAESPMWYASIGLAMSTDGGRTFAKHGPAPVMARSTHDPWMVASPFVLREGDRWRMWYVSGQGWDGARSSYHVKYADSADGVDWRRDGLICLANREPDERNVARTCVIRDDDGGYRAWYCSDRGDGYRIGYAESPDGLIWQRPDGDWGLAPAGKGWESSAVAYPFVVRHRDQLFMFYNGDGFGRDGIGLARRPYG